MRYNGVGLLLLLLALGGCASPPAAAGGSMAPARLESWVRRLLLPVPEAGQVLPATFWFQPERYHLPTEVLPLHAGTDHSFDLPWRLELERLDQIDSRPVASLLVSREERFPPGGGHLTGGLTTSGFARVDARTGLTRTADWRESGRFGLPLTSEDPATPWLLVTIENRFMVTRIEARPSP